MKKHLGTIILLGATFLILQNVFAEGQLQNTSLNQEKDSEKTKPVYALAGGQDSGLTSFPSDEITRKIIMRSDLQKEGDRLAAQGLYEQAIVKFNESMNPALLNYDRDVAGGIEGISRIYQRQGRYEEALREYQWFINADKKGPFATDNSGRYANTIEDRKMELEALIKFKESSSPKAVYDYIAYLRKRYKKYIPPQSKSDPSFRPIPINSIIHLYDSIGDVDRAIEFMNEILSSKAISLIERKEYKRVKDSFEEDKNTGQKGHLRKVIETSEYIGW